MMIQTDAIGAKYDALLDRDSADEIIKAKGDEAAAAAAAAKAETEAQKAAAEAARARTRSSPGKPPAARPCEGSLANQRLRTAKTTPAPRGRNARRRAAREAAKPSMADKMMQSAGRSIASVGRAPARQFAASGDFRRIDPWSLMRRAWTFATLEREWRDALIAKDEDALRRLIHPRFKLVGIRSTGSVAVNLEQWIDWPCSGWTSPARGARDRLRRARQHHRRHRRCPVEGALPRASRSTSGCC